MLPGHGEKEREYEQIVEANCFSYATGDVMVYTPMALLKPRALRVRSLTELLGRTIAEGHPKPAEIHRIIDQKTV